MSKFKKLPQFRNEVEEAEFWQTHDSNDYIDWAKAKHASFPNLKPSTKIISFFISHILYQTLHTLSIPPRLWIAYSGGLDSHVLLHSLVQLQKDSPDLQIRAIHVNHSLNSKADQWSLHCQRVCDVLNVPYIIKKINPEVYTNKANVEAIARAHRYEIFSALLQAGETLLTAHHQNDQAETVLLRLLRGAGSKGLSAIPLQRALGQGRLVRPLLHISRTDLEAYAKHENLDWIEDDSNAWLQLDRNYLRHEILPLLEARWPGAVRAFSRTADHCAETNLLLDELLAENLTEVCRTASSISVSKLKELNNIRQKAILRFWLSRLGHSLPSSKKFQQLIHNCLYAKTDAVPVVCWGGVEVRRFDDHLYAIPPLPEHDATQIIQWDTKKPLVLPAGMGILTAEEHLRQMSIPDGVNVTVRFRQGGERFRPQGRVGSHPLKKLFQEWRVPPWLRDRIPLIYFDDALVAVIVFTNPRVLWG